MNKITPRVRSLIIVVIALFALTLLAASLGALRFSEGKPIPANLEAPQIMDPEMPDELSRWILMIFRVVLVIAWVGLPFFIIYLILNKEARKRFLRDMIAFLPILLVLLMIATISRQDLKKEEPTEMAPGAGQQMPSAVEGTPYPLPEYVPPPAWVTTATTVAIAVGAALLIGGAVLLILRREHRRTEPLRLVEQQAQAALDSIQSGGDLREAILRCYYQMIAALDEYRGIRRARDITPHEFENILRERGLPRGPVHELTQLFEQVRYGGYNPGRSEETVAVTSLSAIVSACQRTRGE